MTIFSVFALLGGLALFLYGMNLMGSGLEKASGGKLERVLEKMTNNPIKGVFLGAFVTAVIQSSSAVTVMVVGFVNSGIMQLSQAVSSWVQTSVPQQHHGSSALLDLTAPILSWLFSSQHLLLRWWLLSV